MNQPGDPSAPATNGRLWGLCLATVFGSFFLLFLSGLVFQRDAPEWTVANFAGVLFLTGWCGLMTAAGIGILLRRAWGEKLLDRLADVGLVTMSGALLFATAWGARNRLIGQVGVLPGDGAKLVLVLVWAAFGGLLAWGDRTPKSTLGTATLLVLWPLLLLLRAPAVAGTVIAILLSCVVGGDWLGSIYGRPYLGAILGLGGFVALIVFGVHLSRDRR